MQLVPSSRPRWAWPDGTSTHYWSIGFGMTASAPIDASRANPGGGHRWVCPAGPRALAGNMHACAGKQALALEHPAPCAWRVQVCGHAAHAAPLKRTPPTAQVTGGSYRDNVATDSNYGGAAMNFYGALTPKVTKASFHNNSAGAARAHMQQLHTLHWVLPAARVRLRRPCHGSWPAAARGELGRQATPLRLVG